MKCSRYLALVVILVLMVAGGTATAQDAEPLRITFVINGVLGDQSFFDSAWNGMQLLLEDGYDIEVNPIELSSDASAWESGLSDAMAQTDAYDILIAGTDQMGEHLARRAHRYPDKRFIFFDDTVPYDDPAICQDACRNVYSIVYAQNEGSFMAGVYAAAITASDLEGVNADPVIGAIGGQDTPVIKDFIVGYEQGACLVNPARQVLIQYAGSWRDPARGKEIALAMYAQKADVIFQIAGPTGAGVFEAAQEQGRYAIGVDSDQGARMAENNPERAQHILTSMLKKVDLSLYLAVDRHIKGELPYGEAEALGYTDGVTVLAENDIYYEHTPENILDLMDAVEAALLNGDITVNTVFEDRVDMGFNLVEGVGLPCDQMPGIDFDVSEFLGE